MKNVTLSKYLKIATLVAAGLLGFSVTHADVGISSQASEGQAPLTDGEITGLTGKWALVDADTFIVVESVTPEGKAKVKMFGIEGVVVKEAVVTRYLGMIPMLTITTFRGDKPHGSFKLMHDDKFLAGTFNNKVDGRSVEVTFALKQDTAVSVN